MQLIPSLLEIFSCIHHTNSLASEATSLQTTASSTNQTQSTPSRKPTSFFRGSLQKIYTTKNMAKLSLLMKFLQDTVIHIMENSNFSEDQEFLELALAYFFFFFFPQVKDPFLIHSHFRFLLYEDIFLKHLGL